MNPAGASQLEQAVLHLHPAVTHRFELAQDQIVQSFIAGV